MTMLSFSQPWGFVKNSHDERGILKSWRQGLDFFGFAGRSKFCRNCLIHLPGLSAMLLPKTTDESGMGWLMSQAINQVADREVLIKEKGFHGRPDFMQQ